ncbi:MAG: peptide-methionine (R)-S-oxide reductase MsrB [Halobacteria archaeon]
MTDEKSNHGEDLSKKSEEYWRSHLSEEEYRILREGGTEPKFSGDYVDQKEDGVYTCGGCGVELFSSEEKFESGTGWPSFWDARDNIETRLDDSHGMRRTEVVCSNCGGHLGHVFDDGPDPTGKRYCINSAALGFEDGGED